MGESDRMSEHISAYLENTLDPATRAEFEQALQRSPELKNYTDQVSKLSSVLGKLPAQKCSEDFVIKLRQRINTAPANQPAAPNIRRYSFAFSFVIIVLVAFFGLKGLLKKDEIPPLVPTMDEFQSAPTSVSSGTANTPASTYSNQGEVDIKTRAESKMVKDSSDILRQDQNNTQAKQVGHSTK